jgi:hypothetical protein
VRLWPSESASARLLDPTSIVVVFIGPSRSCNGFGELPNRELDRVSEVHGSAHIIGRLINRMSQSTRSLT